MKTFDLELRITTFGSILAWEVLLEDATDKNQRVLDWLQGDGCRYKLLPGYQIKDDILNVFVGCQGIKGGTVTCEVVINNERRPNKVISRVEERNYAQGDYPID